MFSPEMRFKISKIETSAKNSQPERWGELEKTKDI